MPFQKGHKLAKGGARERKKPKQWARFVEYCMDGGLDKFQKEMDKLEGKDFVHCFINILEFHKPKLARTEIKDDSTTKVIVISPNNNAD